MEDGPLGAPNDPGIRPPWHQWPFTTKPLSAISVFMTVPSPPFATHYIPKCHNCSFISGDQTVGV